jgi:hypothetical protein
MYFTQRALKTRNDANYRTVPKHRRRSILPMRACRKQNRFVPVEPSLNTAIRFGLRRSSACTILQFQRHGMLRVPKLACASVCDSMATSPRRCLERSRLAISASLHAYRNESCIISFESDPQERTRWRTLQDRAILYRKESLVSATLQIGINGPPPPDPSRSSATLRPPVIGHSRAGL